MHFITMTEATMQRIQAEWGVTFDRTDELNGGLVVVMTESGVIASLLNTEKQKDNKAV